MIHQELPKIIYPFRHSKDRLRLVGKIKTRNMSRLADAIHNRKCATVTIDMFFNVDEESTPYLRGRFASSLISICERCTNIMSLTITSECLLALINNEHRIKYLSKQYEPWIINSSEPVQLSLIVEDELILALPLVQKHNFNCLSLGACHSLGEGAEKTRNLGSPFAALSSLKLKN